MDDDPGTDRRSPAVRSLAAAGLAVVAVLAVVVGIALVVGLSVSGDGSGGNGPDGPDAVAPGEDGTAPGTRLVGIGHLAVAVPEEWGRNQTECGTPQTDTVVIDQGVVCLALVPRPAGVESVELHRRRPVESGGLGSADTTSVQVAGRRAERSEVQCRPQGTGLPVEVCRAWLHFSAERVTFVAESSSSDARARLDEMLGWVRFVDDRVAVPGLEGLHLDVQTEQPGGNGAERYAAELRELGLAVRTVTEPRPGTETGRILGVEPAPGTMLEPGATVTVTVVG